MLATAETLSPTSYDEVAAALRDSAPRSVLVRGGGTKMAWGTAPESADVMLDTTSLSMVVEHNPGDLVVVAQAGVRLGDLQARLAQHGQVLALDPPEDGATLGGIVSANASGPRRHRYGTVRDLLIGAAVVLADGTVARAGGKVVKNVAGYDLMKVFTGALGTLGVVVETAWRLHPLPPARRVVTFPSYDGALVLKVLHSALTPVAVEVLAEQLVVVFESTEPSVEAQAASCAGLTAASTQSDTLPAAFGRRPEAPVLLKIATEIAAHDQVLTALPPGAAVSGRVGVGVLEVGLAELDPAGLERLRAAVRPCDGSVVVLDAPDELRAAVDVWGPVGDALPLMRRVKQRFDPGRRLAPGRFVGGI